MHASSQPTARSRTATTLMCSLLLLLVPAFTMTPASGASSSATNTATIEKPIHARQAFVNTPGYKCKQDPNRELIWKGPLMHGKLCVSTCPPGWITTKKLCLQSTKVSFPAQVRGPKMDADQCAAGEETLEEKGQDTWCIETCPAGMTRKRTRLRHWCVTKGGFEQSWTRPTMEKWETEKGTRCKEGWELSSWNFVDESICVNLNWKK